MSINTDLKWIEHKVKIIVLLDQSMNQSNGLCSHKLNSQPVNHELRINESIIQSIDAGRCPFMLSFRRGWKMALTIFGVTDSPEGILKRNVEEKQF